MLRITAPSGRLAVATALALLSAGCVAPLGLGVVDLASTDPAAVAEADLLGAYAAAKQSVVAPAECSVERSSERVEQSIVKRRLPEPRVTFTATQIEAAAPPAVLDRSQQPELLPMSPPRVELDSLAAAPDQPTGSSLSTQQRFKSIRDISLDIRPPQLFNDQQQAMPAPLDEAAAALPLMAQQHPFTRGDLANSDYDWQPTPEGLTFCYQPLYFQEVNVERYGRSFGMFQPLVSVVSFYGRVPLLPYMAFARPARQCTCPPHWSLPGYRIPEWEQHEFVPSLDGGIAETAAIAGLILLIP